METVDIEKNICEECTGLERSVRIRSRIIVAGFVVALLLGYPTFLGLSFLIYKASTPPQSGFHKEDSFRHLGYDSNGTRLIAYGRHVVKEGTKNSTLDCIFEEVLWAAPGVETDYVKGDRVSRRTINPGTGNGYGEGVVLLFDLDLREPSEVWNVFDGKVSYSKDISVAELVEIKSKSANTNDSEAKLDKEP